VRAVLSSSDQKVTMAMTGPKIKRPVSDLGESAFSIDADLGPAIKRY
jgi:hypothetical protein